MYKLFQAFQTLGTGQVKYSERHPNNDCRVNVKVEVLLDCCFISVRKICQVKFS